MSFTITPHGVLARIPIIELDEQTFGDLSWYEGDYRLLLILRRRVSKSSATLPLYDIGLCNPSLDPDEPTPTPRFLKVPKDAEGGLALQLNLTPSVWRELYLSQESLSEAQTVLYIPTNHDFPPFIRFPEYLFEEFLTRYRAEELVIKNPILPWRGTPSATISFVIHHPRYGSLHITLQFGRCHSGIVEGLNRWRIPKPGPAWLNVLTSSSSMVSGDQFHRCPTDHITHWPGLYKRFDVITGADGETPGPGRRVVKWTLRMTFERSIYAPDLLNLTRILLGVRYATQEDLKPPPVIVRQHPVLAAVTRMLSCLYALVSRAAEEVAEDVTTVEPDSWQFVLHSMAFPMPRFLSAQGDRPLYDDAMVSPYTDFFRPLGDPRDYPLEAEMSISLPRIPPP